jgi:hypothetical protein
MDHAELKHGITTETLGSGRWAADAEGTTTFLRLSGHKAELGYLGLNAQQSAASGIGGSSIEPSVARSELPSSIRCHRIAHEAAIGSFAVVQSDSASAWTRYGKATTYRVES